jgi:hypothetical protein
VPESPSLHVDPRGVCDHCRTEFPYTLIHNGFNESAFAYCEACGATSILDGCFKSIPAGAGFTPRGPVPPSAEAFLAPCDCGGHFRGSASPRCPRCRHDLSAEIARPWIEANAPGSTKGWTWQGSWVGLYCIVIAGKAVSDNWLTTSPKLQL